LPRDNGRDRAGCEDLGGTLPVPEMPANGECPASGYYRKTGLKLVTV